MRNHNLLLTIVIILMPHLMLAQSTEKSDIQIFAELKTQDSILFHAGFVTCDFEILRSLMTQDLEFYHDVDGITKTADAFVKNIKEGICAMDFPPRRELVEGSLEVFPLKKNGSLYGAIQQGIHRFYERYQGGNEQLVGIAKFTHLWMLENNQWVLSRVLSYDHGPASQQ